MNRTLLLLLALSAGCAVPAGRPAPPCELFALSTDFTPTERSAVHTAVERWNARSELTICLKLQETGAPLTAERAIVRVTRGSEDWATVETTHPDFAGFMEPHRRTITIVGELGLVTTTRVTLHEIGHAFGLEHTPAPSIMHEWDGTADDLTEIDIVECRRVGACHIAR